MKWVDGAADVNIVQGEGRDRDKGEGDGDGESEDRRQWTEAEAERHSQCQRQRQHHLGARWKRRNKCRARQIHTSRNHWEQVSRVREWKEKKNWHKCLWYSKRMTTATNYDDDEKPGLAGGLWTLPAKWNVIYTKTNTHCIVCRKTNIGQTYR